MLAWQLQPELDAPEKVRWRAFSPASRFAKAASTSSSRSTAPAPATLSSDLSTWTSQWLVHQPSWDWYDTSRFVNVLFPSYLNLLLSTHLTSRLWWTSSSSITVSIGLWTDSKVRRGMR